PGWSRPSRRFPACPAAGKHPGRRVPTCESKRVKRDLESGRFPPDSALPVRERDAAGFVALRCLRCIRCVALRGNESGRPGNATQRKRKPIGKRSEPAGDRAQGKLVPKRPRNWAKSKPLMAPSPLKSK